MISLSDQIAAHVAAGASVDRDAVRATFAQLREALSSGQVRAAEPDASSPVGWRVNTWVKQGILLGFRFGDVIDVSADHGRWPFADKDTLPLRRLDPGAGVRIVPGGSTVRAWCQSSSAARRYRTDRASLMYSGPEPSLNRACWSGVNSFR